MSLEEKLIVWKGYYSEKYHKKYCAKIPESKFLELWKKFKNFKGSQKYFYFKYMNPQKILE